MERGEEGKREKRGRNTGKEESKMKRKQRGGGAEEKREGIGEEVVKGEHRGPQLCSLRQPLPVPTLISLTPHPQTLSFLSLMLSPVDVRHRGDMLCLGRTHPSCQSSCSFPGCLTGWKTSKLALKWTGASAVCLDGGSVRHRTYMQ